MPCSADVTIGAKVVKKKADLSLTADQVKILEDNARILWRFAYNKDLLPMSPDIEQELKIAMIKAIKSFDPDKKTKLQTWIYYKMGYSLKDFFRKLYRSESGGRGIYPKYLLVFALRAIMDPEEIAEILSIDRKRVFDYTSRAQKYLMLKMLESIKGDTIAADYSIDKD